MRKRAVRKRGLMEETPVQLILLFVSFVVLVLLISSIFQGAGIADKLCKAVPWLCSASSDVDYAVSERSTAAVACAVGSAATGSLWSGGSGFNCNEFYQTTATGTGKPDGVAAVTGAASSDEELRLSQVRNLQPSVTCPKDNTGKMVCTVRNFVMPQEVSNWEEWIAYWGDPDYLVYWNSFPHEEDTWNFEIQWWQHGVVALFAIIPWGKVTSIGTKVAATVVKGPSKSLLAHKAAEIVWENTEKQALRQTLQSGLAKVAPAEAEKLVQKTFKELGEQEIEIIANNLGGLKKRQLINLVKNLEGELGRGYFAKQIAIDNTVEAMKKTLLKPSIKKDLLILGKFAVGEAALHTLAESSMKKYEPVGNSIAIKNPGNKTEDIKKFPLPDEIKLKPVLVKWKPGIGSIIQGFPQTQVKNLNFASPCYLKEFNVTREDNILCKIYAYDGENVSCLDAEVTTDEAPLVCNTFDEYSINKNTGMDIYGKLQDLLKMKDKSLFEFDDDWNLTKINLPWFMKDDKSGPKYSLKEFAFSSKQYTTTQIPTSGGVIPNPKDWSKDVKIGENFILSDVVGRTYKANFSEGSKDRALITVEDDDKTVMENAKEYVLHIYNIPDDTSIFASDDVEVDIYDLEFCDIIMDIPKTEPYYQPYHKQLSCADIRKTGIEQKQISDIKGIMEDVQNTRGKEKIIKVKATGNIKLGDLNVWGIGKCASAGFSGKQNCFRILDKITVEIGCKEKGGSQFYQKIHEETCEMDIPMLEKELGKNGKISFKRDIVIGEDIDGTPNYKIANIVYSTQSYQLDNDVIVGFEDNDENSQWDLMLLVSKYKILPKIFNITLSNIDDNGVFRHIAMTNCKTDGVLVTFKDNDLPGAKMNVEGDNYCMRQSSTFTKYWQAGKEIFTGIGIIATGIISGGSTTAIYIAGIVGAGVEGLGAINYERTQIWPKSAGG